MAKAILDKLKEQFGEALVSVHQEHGDECAVVDRDHIVSIAEFLKSEPSLDCNMLMDVCGVDYLHLKGTSPRFAVVYNFYSLTHHHRVRIKVHLEEDDCRVPSLTSLYRSADWGEREAYDMYGIHFEGHPNLQRILTHDEFVGHALRKDYPVEKGQWLSAPSEITDFSDTEEMKNQCSDELRCELLPLNLGPSHPAMHGALRVKVLLDGETILKSATEIGYLHRAFEKSAETHTYTQVIPYTDRLNYCSSLLNNAGYCYAVEKLMGLKLTPRGTVLRVIISEIARIIDHLVCIGAQAVDVGALTNFWYFFNVREKFYDLIEHMCGARLTTTYTRIGGFSYDVVDDFEEQLRHLLDNELDQAIKDVAGLLEKNRIFIDRTHNVGVISAEDAISYGFTGPCLRACGIGYDVRKAHPYYDYDKYDFDVPIGGNGDTYDRMLLRFEEMRQSRRILHQALDDFPDGPVSIDDPRVTFPPKQQVYDTIEGMMNQFKLVYEGILPPPGETYGYVEGANGELGFYIISDGSGTPYRIKVRPPCFYIFRSFDQLIQGSMVADAIAVLGSLNIIAGELDR